jgi:hypothetical protein
MLLSGYLQSLATSSSSSNFLPGRHLSLCV